MSDSFYAEFVNANEVLANFRAARELLARMRGAREITDTVRKAVHDEAPEGCTGKLRAGIYDELLYRTSGFESTVYSDAFYVKWIIGGRGPVRPVRARVLHWKACSGEDVFAMYAKAVPPNRFHERAWNKVAPEVTQKWHVFGESVAVVLAT